jgi:nucleoid DNA-binding protein
MRKPHWLALGALVVALGLSFTVTSLAQPPRPPERLPLPAAVAKKSKLSEDDVKAMLEALGPIVREKLANGETVELPGLGTIRVVRIPEHKDMVQGRPATITAVNNVEFLPVPEVVQAANAPGAVPAVTVPVFEFDPLPGQTRSQRAPYVRTPGDRIR